MHCEEKKETPSKGSVNAAVALGAIGTGLGVINSGFLGGGLFGRGGCGGERGARIFEEGRGWEGGRGCPPPCRGVATCGDLLEIERQFNCVEKQFAGVEREIGNKSLFFQKELGNMELHQQSLTYRTALESQKADCELAMKEACDVRDLYRYNDKTAFELYKGQRDMFDIQQAEIGKLHSEVAVMAAVRPYQDKILRDEICLSAERAQNNLDRRTCRMITGEVVLPLTPTVTGVASINNCGCAQTVAASA